MNMMTIIKYYLRYINGVMIKKNKDKVEQGFSYTSDNNKDWMSISLKSGLKIHSGGKI